MSGLSESDDNDDVFLVEVVLRRKGVAGHMQLKELKTVQFPLDLFLFESHHHMP